MNCKIFLAIIALVLYQSRVNCQTVQYGYDANGNRTSRTIIVEELRSNAVAFPVENPEELQPKLRSSKSKGSDTNMSEDLKNDKLENETEEIEKIVDEGEISTTIYPNPNKGILKIDIKNMPVDSRKEMRLYDLSGTELIIKKDFQEHSEMDISHIKDGIYILRIIINGRILDFKVIKNH